MRLLHFLIKRRLQYYFSWSGNWKGLAGDLALVLLFSFSALVLSWLYTNGNSPGFALKIDRHMLIRGVAVSMMIMPLILKVFPSFRLKQPFIGAQFPVSRTRIAQLDLFVFVICRSRNFCYLLYLTLFCTAAQPLDFYTVLGLYLFLAGGILLAENVVGGISWKKPVYLLLTLITAIMQYEVPELRAPGHLLFWCSTLLVALQFLFYFVFYTHSPVNSHVNIQGRSGAQGPGGTLATADGRIGGLYMKMLTRNRPVITTLGIGYLFKCLILSAFIFKKGDSLAFIVGRVPFIICLISPIILFTYVFNNLWTYFYSVALNSILTGTGWVKQARMYLLFLLPALLLDVALTFGLLALKHLVDGRILLTYLTIAVFTLCIGFISTFTRYFPAPLVLDFNQFRARTSRLYTFVLLLVTIAIGLAYNDNIWFFLSLGLLWLISALLCLLIYRNMDYLSNQLKQRFFTL